MFLDFVDRRRRHHRGRLPDGKLIAAGSLDRTVRVWDSTTGFLVERLDSGNENGNGHEDSVYSVAFSNNGEQIASGSLDRTVKLWHLEGKSDKKSTCEVTYIGHKDFVLSVCCTPTTSTFCRAQRTVVSFSGTKLQVTHC